MYQHLLNWEKGVVKSQRLGNFRVTENIINKRIASIDSLCIHICFSKWNPVFKENQQKKTLNLKQTVYGGVEFCASLFREKTCALSMGMSPFTSSNYIRK